VYDAFLNEEPKSKGFGETLIVDYLNRVQPDIVIIYNDLVVITTLLDQIEHKIPSRKFKLYPYIDIVYQNEKNIMIEKINSIVDGGIMFTDYWKNTIVAQGFNKQLFVLEHGFNTEQYYPIPKELARQFFSIQKDDFVIVNLNRNQPRKRWDICIMAFVKFVAANRDRRIRMIIAASMNGSWDLIDLMISETRKYGMTLEDIKKHLVIMQNPQQLTDFDINVMYNAADVGINTCDGEGFGLCNFEQAGVGIPQVVPNIGGFKDFFNNTNSVLLEPKWSFYCDHSRDFVSGEAQICAVDDYVKGLQYMLDNPIARQKMGQKARKHIVKNYMWKDKGAQFEQIIRDIYKREFGDSKDNPVKVDINELIKNKTAASTNPAEIKDADIDSMDSDQLREFVRKMRMK
jgi:glycosyltransferase involved in cell wall biosynthesis